MGYQTDLFVNISFYKQHFESKSAVRDAYEEAEQSERRAKEDLVSLAMITEPKKFCDEEQDPMGWLQIRIQDAIEDLAESCIDKYRYGLLLESWDTAHDEEGYAKPLPDGVSWDTAYIDGDFVKHKNDEEE